jgi:hypothetical protein
VPRPPGSTPKHELPPSRVLSRLLARAVRDTGSGA